MRNHMSTDDRVPRGKFYEEKQYWTGKLAGAGSEVSGFPLDFPRQNTGDNKRAAAAISFPAGITQRLSNIANKSEYGLFMLLITGINYLLYKYTGAENILIGVPPLKPGTDDAGPLLSPQPPLPLLPIKNTLKGTMTFKDLLTQVKTTLAEAEENTTHFPFTEIIKLLKLPAWRQETHLMDTLAIFENIHEKEAVKHHQPDVIFTFVLNPGTLTGEINYNSALFSPGISRLGQHLVNYFKAVTRDPLVRLSRLDCLSRQEKQEILYGFNDTQRDYPKDKSLTQLFTRQAGKTPGRTAVMSRDLQLTYEELNRKVNRLAGLLVKGLGVGSGDIIGTHVSRSLDMVIAVLGILRAGGVVLPIEPKCPSQRIELLLKDSSAGLVLKSKDLEFSWAGRVKTADIGPGTLTADETGNIEEKQSPDSPAYVIYTSGSTGTPKGVLLQHAGIINHTYTKIRELELHRRDILCHSLSISFVASIWQVFAPLYLGAALRVYPDHIIMDAYEMFNRVSRDRVTAAEVVPSLLNTYLDLVEAGKPPVDLSGMRVLVLTGEAVPVPLVNRFFSRYQVPLLNAYGQSECSDDTLHYAVPYNRETRMVPVGKPSNNTRVYVLGTERDLQPIGALGELYIGGDGLAPGYLNRPQLTAEKFVCNPYEKNGRMYRTGDFARWLPDGNIQFKGRVDHQVKIRGFRVELGEIENRLLSHEAIDNAVVTVRDESLCAYFTSSRGNSFPGVPRLKEYLGQSLPDYMIPHHFIRLEEIPLTTSGKIDRKNLPGPRSEESRTNEPGAAVSVEDKLADIFARVLRLEKTAVNRETDFFKAGGHSLKAVILISTIHKELNVEISLLDLFENPTVQGLSGYIRGSVRQEFVPIEPVEKKEYYGLSSAQKRLYILHRIGTAGTKETGTGNVSYNIPAVTLLEGETHREKVQETLQELIRRHESFRTSFHLEGSEPVQKIHDRVEFVIESPGETVGPDPLPAVAARSMIKNFIRPFDLSQAPLLRAGLIGLEPRKYLLLLDMHHIIADGTSIGIMAKEFMAVYKGEGLSPLRIRYRDFCRWQNRGTTDEEMKKQEIYWLEEFAGEVPVLHLPTDYPRPALQSFEGSSKDFQLAREEAANLRALARNHDCTLHQILLAIFTLLLSKLSGQEDIIVGIPTAGRNHENLQEIIGMFVNTLGLRGYPLGDLTGKQWLDQVKKRTITAFENQDYPFEDLVEKLGVNRDASRNPLFDVTFAWQNFELQPEEMQEIDIPGLKLLPYRYENTTAKFDLTLIGREAGEDLLFTFEYCTRLFKAGTVDQWVHYFKNIVSAFIKSPGTRLSGIRVLTDEERSRVLDWFNETGVGYPVDKTIDRLFEEQAGQIPDNIAVVAPLQEINGTYRTYRTYVSYRQLNRDSGRLEQWLRQRGIQEGDIVALKMERSIEMPVAILGILKAGGAYLPIDTEYPQERISYILADSAAAMLLTTVSTLPPADKRESHPHLRPEPAASLAYIIYTSGTSGNPKGVLVEHRSVVRLLFNRDFRFEFSSSDRWTMFHSYNFDFSVWEMYGALLYGGKLMIISRGTARDTGKFLEILKKEKITVLNQTPSAFYRLSRQELKSGDRQLTLRYVIFGGEALAPAQLKEWYQAYPRVKLINMYGITETTVHVTYKEIGPDEIRADVSNIGRPIPTLQLYVLDRYLNPVPEGVAGELYVGGTGVARGYLNRPELSAERFIKIPQEYRSYRTYIYSTGDRVRIIPGRELEYLGRLDSQVKIRGYRVELAEIENRLVQHEDITAAVVTAPSEKNGQRFLCAYFVPSKALEIAGLRRYLSGKLPGYMIPSYFVAMERIPLTPNGKVDREALPGPGWVPGNDYEPPANAIEKKLTEIWAEVLGGRGAIGVHDNFFERGGHSLTAIDMVSRVYREMKVKLPLVEVFQTPSIRELARYIESARSEMYISLGPMEKKEYYPLSSTQEQFYFLQQMDVESTSYNTCEVWESVGEVKKEKLEWVFRELLGRHESFRTIFRLVDGQPVQQIQPGVEFEIKEYDLDTAKHWFVRPFDLSRAPLLRVGLIKTASGRSRLLVDMHHIITDAGSREILVREFNALQRGEVLSPLKLQYRDFPGWLNSDRMRETLKHQEAYWVNLFQGKLPILSIPTDYPRPRVQSFAGDFVSGALGLAETRALKAAALDQGTSLYMVLLALYNILLAKLSGQEDIVVGTPASGRIHPDLENIVGVFVNTLALRNYPHGEKPFNQFLGEIKERTLTAFENRAYPLADLVDRVVPHRDPGRNPLFDVMFDFHVHGAGEEPTVDDREEPLEWGSTQGPMENRTSKVDFLIFAEEIKGRIVLNMQYCTGLYKKHTMEGFLQDFKKITRQAIENPQVKINQVELLDKKERDTIDTALQRDIEGVAVDFDI
jgi:amino acid adenylation domain-containing protein